MELSPADVRDVLKAMDSSGLDELHLELGSLFLTVRREGATGWTAEQRVLRQPVVEGGAESAAAEPAAQRAALADGLVAVHPPLLGTFYRAPKPGAPPFVDVGDQVEEDTVIGVVETMKMMTPVRAGVRGRVVEFWSADGEFADADAVLLVVDPGSGTAGPGEAAR